MNDNNKNKIDELIKEINAVLHTTYDNKEHNVLDFELYNKIETFLDEKEN